MAIYKNIYDKLRQPLTRVITHGAQGYLFGSMVGLLTKDKLCKVHSSGIKFAKVGMVYAGSEAVLEQFHSGIWTRVASGVIAGSMVNGVKGGIGFGLYSGVVEMYNKEDVK